MADDNAHASLNILVLPAFRVERQTSHEQDTSDSADLLNTLPFLTCLLFMHRFLVCVLLYLDVVVLSLRFLFLLCFFSRLSLCPIYSNGLLSNNSLVPSPSMLAHLRTIFFGCLGLFLSLSFC